MKRNIFLLFIALFFIVSMAFTIDVKALESSNYVTNNSSNIVRLADETEFESEEDMNNCQYVFGDPNRESSVAWMIQKAFNYVKIIGPLLVIVLSGIDFAKNTLISDAEGMKKATKKLTIRLVCAVLLYFIPLITSFILNTINNTVGNQTCGIS